MTDSPERDDRFDELIALQRSLLEATAAWSQGTEPGPEVADLRRAALGLLHLRYVQLIPLYRELAGRQDATGPVGVDFIVDNLLLLDVFKSYDPAWLASGDFPRLTDWLGTIFTRRPALDLSGVTSVSAWRARLRADGIFLSFSSGTSGRMAFVPRDALTFRALCTNGSTYTDESWRRRADGSLEDFDCLVAGPRSGGMGILDAGAGLARTAARSHFLYEDVLTADAVRAVGAGQRAPRAGIDPDEAYGRAFDFVRRSAADDRKLLLFGAPFQVKRLAEAALASGGPLPTAPGSIVVTGGGWKSFRGEALLRTGLLELIREALGIAASGCIDAYSTSELNCTFRTCREGCYHIPPLVEAVVLDEAMTGRVGLPGTGMLAFLDPFAFSYPGFVITGDRGTLVQGRCRCGLPGPFLDGEIRRAEGMEVRGCGGVLESMSV